MLNKTLVVMIFVTVLAACQSKVEGPYDGSPNGAKNSEQSEGLSEYEKQQALTKQANKIKCQDARMDMVDAEAQGDVNMIRLVKARLIRYCEPDE